MGLFDGAIHNLAEQALDATWYKQQVISNNIANASTPDFKAKTVEFGLILKEKCECKYHTPDEDTDGKLSLSVITTQETDTNQLLNGNNVDQEKEALALADAQYQYSALMDQLNHNYAVIRSAIAR